MAFRRSPCRRAGRRKFSRSRNPSLSPGPSPSRSRCRCRSRVHRLRRRSSLKGEPTRHRSQDRRRRPQQLHRRHAKLDRKRRRPSLHPPNLRQRLQMRASRLRVPACPDLPTANRRHRLPHGLRQTGGSKLLYGVWQRCCWRVVWRCGGCAAAAVMTLRRSMAIRSKRLQRRRRRCRLRRAVRLQPFLPARGDRRACRSRSSRRSRWQASPRPELLRPELRRPALLRPELLRPAPICCLRRPLRVPCPPRRGARG